MKKNLYLLGTLIVLLIGTYLFQELRSNKVFEESLVKDHLIKASELKTLSFGDVKAIKKETQWWAGDKLLSANVMKELEKRIGQVKKIKNIEGEKKSFFSNPIKVEVNGEEWLIGELTLDRQGFYLARGDEVMIAVSEGEGQELTDAPGKVAEVKLEELKKGLSFKIKDLNETQLFRYYPKLPLGTVAIESDGRPSYELDLVNNKTLPPPIYGIVTQTRMVEKFTSLLTQMTIVKEVPFAEVKKFSKLGSLVLSNDFEKVRWELWLNSKNSAESFILDSDKKQAWQMVGGTLKIFFIQVQDYWDKKVIPPKEFSNFSRLKVTFSEAEKSAVVEVLNREPLEFETSKYKVDREKMNILFQYAFNLSEKDQADRISQLSKSERKEILSGKHLRLEVMGQELLFWRKQDELIVVNLTQGFKAHFFVTQESFRGSFEDVLK